MTHSTSRTRPGLMLLAGLLVGLVAGFAAGYYLPSRGAADTSLGPTPAAAAAVPHPQEFTVEVKGVSADVPGTYDVAYAEPFTRAPELTILTDEMKRGVAYTLADQRADGFRIKLGSNTTRTDNPFGSAYLKYRARGEVADKLVRK